ncbi:MAG TPA: PDZ domain-containing protein [Vicinamibacteria bacterium]|nr:PDZ domain-containing protein [Vicinamibacteria bacterium]
MSRGTSFGIGAGAASLLAALVAVSPAVQGDTTVARATRTTDSTRSENKSESKPEGKADRRVRIVMGGGSHLGVRLEDIDQDDLKRLKLSEEKGALVKSVEEGGPADKAGLKEGDVIVRYHGESVLSASQLARLVRETPAGRTVPIEVMRDGGAQKLTATLGGDDHRSFGFPGDLGELDIPMPEIPEVPLAPMPPLPPKMPHGFDKWGKRALLDDHFMWFSNEPRKLGLEFQEVSGQLAKYFKLAEDSGVLVTSVEAGGPAEKAGLKAGDLILKFDGRSVKGGDDLEKAVRKAEAGLEVPVTVQRDGRSLELKVIPDGERPKSREGTEL